MPKFCIFGYFDCNSGLIGKKEVLRKIVSGIHHEQADLLRILPNVCPLDCPDTCSLNVKVKGDTLVEAKGSKANPYTNGIVCKKVMKYYPSMVHGSDRLTHPLKRVGLKWSCFYGQVCGLAQNNCAGVLPSDVIHANKMAKTRELDAQLAGLFINRAAISGVSADEFEEFMESHTEVLMRLVKEHPVQVEERIAKVGARYRWT